MKVLLSQIIWQFKIVYRNKLILVSFLMTLVYAGIFYLIKDLGDIRKLLTLIIFNDPAIIGLMFAGLSIIIEKKTGVISALFVSPMKLHAFLISKLLVFSIIGTGCGIALALVAGSIQINYLHFTVGIFSTCLIFSMLGLFVVSFTTEFLNYMLRVIPLMLFFASPLLNYFGLMDASFLRFTPMQGGVFLIDNSYSLNPDNAQIWFGYISFLIWIPVMYFCLYHTFKSRVNKIVS